MAAHFRYPSLRSLNRSPMLTAMLVYLVGAAVVAFAVWRGSSLSPNPRRCGEPYLVKQYLVQSAADAVARPEARGPCTGDRPAQSAFSA
jgi:hypothetical protein